MVYIDEDLVFVDASGLPTRAHLQATLPPDDPSAPTEWSYLTTDGSDDAPYLDSTP
jgi:hypothetical protein